MLIINIDKSLREKVDRDGIQVLDKCDMIRIKDSSRSRIPKPISLSMRGIANQHTRDRTLQDLQIVHENECECFVTNFA